MEEGEDENDDDDQHVGRDDEERDDRTPPNNDKKATVGSRRRKRTKKVITPSSSKMKKHRRRQDYDDVSTTPTPHGIPVANRDYKAVPVDEFRETNDDDDNDDDGGNGTVRRSRRTKFKPLAFWKNERLIYEPHDEEGLLGEKMGDMPVVTKVVSALPTPYKKRTIHHNNACGKKKRGRPQ